VVVESLKNLVGVVLLESELVEDLSSGVSSVHSSKVFDVDSTLLHVPVSALLSVLGNFSHVLFVLEKTIPLDDNVEFVDLCGDHLGEVGNVHDMGVSDDVKETVHKSSLVVDILGVLQEIVEDPFSIVVVLRSMFDVLAFDELLLFVDTHVHSVGVFAPSDGLDNVSSFDNGDFVRNLDLVSDVVHNLGHLALGIDCSKRVRLKDASNNMKENSSVFHVTLSDFHEVLPHV
jgi:hypothetical protein